MFRKNPSDRLRNIIREYDTVIRVMDGRAKRSEEADERAYGGELRAVKGKLQEHISEELVRTAWFCLGGNKRRLDINSKKIRIPILPRYVRAIGETEIRRFILENIESYSYGVSVDKHVFIDGKFVIGVECKAYAENAMLKRILVDFRLLKTKAPNLKCFLLQLESQLGGDYSRLQKITYGSKPTHTLMSYFPEVELSILTLLAGERNITRPIHRDFKTLTPNQLRFALNVLGHALKEYI